MKKQKGFLVPFLGFGAISTDLSRLGFCLKRVLQQNTTEEQKEGGEKEYCRHFIIYQREEYLR